MKTLSLLSSSSAKASLRASLTAISFTPLGVAYPRIRETEGFEASLAKDGRTAAYTGRWDKRYEAGRNSLVGAIEWSGEVKGIVVDGGDNR